MSTPRMPLRSSAATLTVALATSLAAVGCTTEVGQEQSAVTGCEGAYLDDGGRCRRPDGRFAKKACCAPPASPSERRTLPGRQLGGRCGVLRRR